MSFALHSLPLLSPSMVRTSTSFLCPVSNVSFSLRVIGKSTFMVKHLACFAESRNSDQKPETNPTSHGPKSKPTRKTQVRKRKVTKTKGENSEGFPGMIPKKPRRGRRSEAAAVEDYVRDTLNRTFESIQKQNPEIMKKVENFMKEKADTSNVSFDDNAAEDDGDSDEEEVSSSGEEEMLVEDEDQDWPLDAEVGWGIRASEYFDQHPIRNTVGEDGTEIDWEGEIDDGLIKEINCLEWESFAFHPSPLVVLVFERYNRANHNWKILKELEKAAEVYWKAKDRLPPRTVKIDINIEKDLAYALKVKECPQILFLRGNSLLYREKDFRTSDELVQMIAHFYYNAKKPSCINDAELTSNQWRNAQSRDTTQQNTTGFALRAIHLTKAVSLALQAIQIRHGIPHESSTLYRQFLSCDVSQVNYLGHRLIGLCLFYMNSVVSLTDHAQLHHWQCMTGRSWRTYMEACTLLNSTMF